MASLMRTVRAAGYRLLGHPPAASAPRSERLRWVRRFYVRPLPITLGIWIWLLITFQDTITYIVFAMMAFIWLEGMVEIGVQIRRAQRRELG